MKKFLIPIIIILIVAIGLYIDKGSKNSNRNHNTSNNYLLKVTNNRLTGFKAYMLAKNDASTRYNDCKLSKLYCNECTREGNLKEGKHWYVYMQCSSESKELEYKIDKDQKLSLWQEIDYKHEKFLDIEDKNLPDSDQALKKIPKDFCANKDVKYYTISLRSHNDSTYWSITCIYTDSSSGDTFLYYRQRWIVHT